MAQHDAAAVKTFYTGGATPAATAKTLPIVGIKDEWEKPEGYVADKDLIAAVNVAITLGRPLLVTGEPGTGKSELAKSVAYDLGLGQPLEFIVKSDTESRDLFYRFDTVGRFNSPRGNGGAENIDATASLFQYLRQSRLGLHKPPATAELLDWLYVLFKSLPDDAPPEDLPRHPRFHDSVKCCLLKNQADQQRALELVDGWAQSRNHSAQAA